MKKKIFPKIKKKLHNFLTDESWKITKKDALWLAAVASMSLWIHEVLAWHTSHTSAPAGGSWWGSWHSNFWHNSNLWCSAVTQTQDSLSWHMSQTSSWHVSGSSTPVHTSQYAAWNLSGHGSATGHSSHWNHTNHANHWNEGSCFTFAQRVLTPTWYICIWSLNEWDEVISYNHELSQYETSIIDIFIVHDWVKHWFTDYSKYSLLKVYIENKDGVHTIESTDVHPFYHPESWEYKKIMDFKVWDEIFMYKTTWTLKSVEYIIDKNKFDKNLQYPVVYNLEMRKEDNHNYFVEGCLVHNAQNLSTEIP